MPDVIHIDGSGGEGGGQILRTSLALSLVTGTPFTIDSIRARRRKPGLLRQHLTAVKAAGRIGNAEMRGAALNSQRLEFAPQGVEPGEYTFTVGTAGSATLVLQTVLPALMIADAASHLTIEGGTHNPYAPPVDFLEDAFLPLLARMGPRVHVRLKRYGFYPAGGGNVAVDIEPASTLARLDVTDRGEVRTVTAHALVARLPLKIARREVSTLARMLDLDERDCSTEEVRNSPGPGNVATVRVQTEAATELFTGFGRKGVPAERVARDLAKEVRAYLQGGAPVGEYLADQLLLPMAIGACRSPEGGGTFATSGLSSHATTNVDVIRRFLDANITHRAREDGSDLVDVAPAGNGSRNLL